MKTVIHVNQHRIKSNRRAGSREPVITCKDYKANRKASEVLVSGPCRVIYTPDEPLPCGATVYILTESEVIVVR